MEKRKKLYVGGAIVLLLGVVAVFLLRSCGYGKVSPEAYKYATALHSICNRRDEQRLEKFSTMLKDARESGKLTKRETRWLGDIVSYAQAGRWETAASMSRRLLKDQVESAP